MARERHAVAQVATGGSCINVRPTAVGMAAASANQQQLLWLPSNGRCLQSRSSLPRPIGACRGRECGNQQPTHVISSSPHVVHAMHMRMVHSSSTLLLRCRLEQQRIRTEATCTKTRAAAPGGSRAACTKTRAAALPLVLRCCPQQPHIGLVLFDRAGLRSSVLSTTSEPAAQCA